MPRTRTRVRNRTRPHDPDYPPARAAQLRRDVRKKMAKFRASLLYERLVAAERSAEATSAQQKAPGLAAGGSACSANESED
ncbi:hypothetical protein ASD38_20105 [Caulobacter sp. Root487D2Y]|uniref:hypothetical protein n=1 Tax=unclassified Caulobacter TaxID=2648921 RepID=UPI0006F3F5E0|nr:MULTISPECIES: hypothetical protein [unclassified Caulobacter]KQY26539.1 hypothetical protein ASD38_20105 [Caulobacter sp. Root487D2Y]